MQRQLALVLTSMLVLWSYTFGQQLTVTQTGGIPSKSESLLERVAARTKLKEADVLKVLEALGPEVQDDLQKGKSVSLPRIGAFRIVKVAEHKDLQNGKPTTIRARNVVEFTADGGLEAAANADGVKPVDSVPPYQHVVLPNASPGLKAPNQRTPPVRVK